MVSELVFALVVFSCFSAMSGMVLGIVRLVKNNEDLFIQLSAEKRSHNESKRHLSSYRVRANWAEQEAANLRRDKRMTHARRLGS